MAVRAWNLPWGLVAWVKASSEPRGGGGVAAGYLQNGPTVLELTGSLQGLQGPTAGTFQPPELPCMEGRHRTWKLPRVPTRLSPGPLQGPEGPELPEDVLCQGAPRAIISGASRAGADWGAFKSRG